MHLHIAQIYIWELSQNFPSVKAQYTYSTKRDLIHKLYNVKHKDNEFIRNFHSYLNILKDKIYNFF